jgi:hypothetical protein
MFASLSRWVGVGDATMSFMADELRACGWQVTPMQSGYVQYGANTIGSISCMPAPPPANASPAAKR